MTANKREPVCGIIGVGSIAAAIVKGIMRNDDGARVVLSPRGGKVSAALAGRYPGVAMATDNQAVVDRCEVVLICVRPRDVHTALRGLQFRAGQTVISAVAGVRLSGLQALTAPATPCRAIPLPAVAERQGSTPVFPISGPARNLFDRLGGTIELGDEAQFDAFSAVTGTIAAHIAYLSTVAGWLAEQGVARGEADRYVANIFSTLDLAPSASEPLWDLSRQHATPGGINEAFAASLAAAGLFDAVRTTLDNLLARLKT